MAHRVEQDCFRSRENIESLGAEEFDGFRGVRPVAACVFHTGDDDWVALQQALDERMGKADMRHRRNLVQVDAQARIADPFDHFAQKIE
ncbi:hypothetical protein D3C71_1588840 [compost metagenome]